MWEGSQGDDELAARRRRVLHLHAAEAGPLEAGAGALRVEVPARIDPARNSVLGEMSVRRSAWVTQEAPQWFTEAKACLAGQSRLNIIAPVTYTNVNAVFERARAAATC